MAQRRIPIERKRGDTFYLDFDLVDSLGAPSLWTPSMFTGGTFFTMRSGTPSSTTLDDTGAIVQVSDTANASGVITWTSTVVGLQTFWHGRVTVHAQVTALWELGNFFGEIRAEVSGSPEVKPPINDADLLIKIVADLKRTP